MQAQDHTIKIIPPVPKTTRGQPSFIESSPTHLLYFNGCTVILRPLDSSPTLYVNHNCLVTAAKFSHGHKQVASIDEKGTLMVHYIDGSKLVLTQNYEGCYAGGKSIDWTSDNKKLCIVGSGKNKYGRIISVDTGTDVGEISACTANLSTVSFRPERPFKLAVGGQQFTAKFYEGPPYKFASSKKSHTNFINQLKYSPDGKKIVSVGSDRKIVLYDGLTFEVVAQLENAHGGGIMGVTWLDNQTFVTASSDKKLRKWGLSLEKSAQIDSFENKQEQSLIDSFVVAVTYSPGSSNIYFLLLSGQIKETDKNLTKITRCFEGHRNKPSKILPIYKDSESALLLDSDGKILQINTKNDEVRRFMRNIVCVNKIFIDFCLSPSGTIHFITGDQFVSQFIIKEQDNQKKQRPKLKIEGAKLITSVTCSQLNAFACYTQNSIRIFAQKNGKYEKVQQAKLSYEPTFAFSNFEASNSSDLIIVGSGKGHIQLFSLEYSEGSFKISKQAQIGSNPYKITYIQKHNDLIFTGDSMGGIRVWKWKNGELEKVSDSMGSHTTMITSILVKGEHIYTFSMDNKYSLWKLQNFTRITTFSDIHRHGIIHAEIIGKRIVSCGGDLLVKVHEL